MTFKTGEVIIQIKEKKYDADMTGNVRFIRLAHYRGGEKFSDGKNEIIWFGK